MEDKSSLLNQLKIEREPITEPSGVSVWIVGFLIILALLIAGGGTYYYFLEQNQALKAELDAAKVAAAEAQSGQGSAPNEVSSNDSQNPTTALSESDRILNASGYITARRIATVSAEITGLLTDVQVEEGMRVERGQVLAKLDDAVASVNLEFAEAQVSVQRARLENIQANLDEANRVLSRVTELKAKDFSTDADLTRAQANVAGLNAQIKSSKADIQVAELEASRQRERLNDHTIRAPFGGIVTVKAAQPGEIVSPVSAGGGFTRTGICTIVDMTSLEIEVDVNEAFIGRVFEGQRVQATLDAYPTWNVPASVIAIIPTADRAKATVKVRIKIETPDPKILPDMGVKVAFLKA